MINNIVEIDKWVINQVLYFRTPTATAAMKYITVLGESTAYVIYSIIMIVILAYLGNKERRINQIIEYCVTMIGGSVLLILLKELIQRPRPISETTLIQVDGWSFPSGHAMMSVVFYGILLYIIIHRVKARQLQLLACAATVLIVVLIGVSRVYLQVHYLSDVIAGYIIGICWLIFCLVGLRIYRSINHVDINI